MRTHPIVWFGTVFLSLLAFAFSAPAHAQTSTGVSLKWEVKSRFRLFKNESDFKFLEDNYMSSGVLASENKLITATGGIGWARRFVTAPHNVMALCVNFDGKPLASCSRQYSEPDAAGHENADEQYFAPESHRIGVTAQGAAAGASCTWQFVTDGAKLVVGRDRPCSKELIAEVPYGKTTQIQLFIAAEPDSAQPTATANVAVRDVLIAGLGDSTASGEGDPDHEIALAPFDGFCFRRVGYPPDKAYYRPSRNGYGGNRSCPTGIDDRPTADEVQQWSEIRAVWMDRACHRSLYSYQLRVALTLALENPQIAVTYIPLGCTGATIPAGLLGPQQARESDCAPGVNPEDCPHSVPGLSLIHI